MFDKYLIRKNSLINVFDSFGKAIGFKMAVRNSNYRGVFASLHNGYYLVVDDVLYPREKQRFELNGKPPRDFDEMKNAGYEHWNFDDEAWLYVEKDGGLGSGKHKFLFKQAVFAAYGYFPGCEEYVTNPPVPGPETRHYLVMDKTFYPVEYELELQN
jgi:hypothetical protein